MISRLASPADCAAAFTEPGPAAADDLLSVFDSCQQSQCCDLKNPSSSSGPMFLRKFQVWYRSKIQLHNMQNDVLRKGSYFIDVDYFHEILISLKTHATNTRPHRV
jgi:hypothetical protein